MQTQRTKISIQFRHPTQNLSCISTLLKLQPTHIWKKGDERWTPKGTKLTGIRESSYCSIHWDAPPEKPLLEQIEAVLTVLKPHRDVLREIVSTGGVVSLNIGWFCNVDTGERIGWQILESIADLRISMDLNIYLPDQKDFGDPTDTTFSRPSP